MAQLTLAFLSTFQATLDSQPITRFRSNNNQGLLVYLALQPDRPIPREVLSTLFWPDEPDSVARNNLRQSVYQLRKVLGDLDSPGPPHLLVTRQTVQFNVDSDFTLDVDHFSQAIERGDLEMAVALYHGELLPGFTCDSLGFEEWLRLEREQLHQVALEAMFEVAEAHLRAGRYEESQAVARQQLGLEPWREQAHRQLMKALVLAGDRPKALAQFELCRELLWNELAVEPAPETVALYEAIKSGEYAAAISDEPIQPPTRPRHNLPADTMPFIGRELELSQLTEALTHEGRRLVTILAPGGMGKTRLAMMAGRQLVDQFADGVYFVDLAPLSSPDEILPSIAVALNYQAPDSTRELKPQLLETVSRRYLLLILDNFEHLMPGGSLVNEILQRCPQVSILATSRQRLNLARETRYELSGLAFHDGLTPEAALTYPAVHLFVDRAQRVQPNFSLSDDNLQDVLQICRQVQGMPLGLILAANWLELLTPAEIAGEIKSSLDFLAADLADLPERQRNMQAVFERSWAMLTGEEQRVMARLSVFRGGFSREAAEDVAGANLRILLGLANKSFVQRQPDSGRYSVHELLRQFAAQKRQQMDSLDEARLAHCRYFARLMANTTRRALYFFPVHLPRQHGADRDNVNRAWEYALEHSLANELLDLVKAVVAFGNAQGMYSFDIPGQAVQVLSKRGVPETDREMLRLRLVDLGFHVDKEEPEHIRQRLLEFLPQLEEKGDPELLYWLYERLRFNSLGPLGPDPEYIEWLDKEYAAAQQMGDEVFIKVTEVFGIWIHSGHGSPLELPVKQLLELHSFFEEDYSDTVIYLGIQDSLIRYYSAVGEYEQALHYGKRNLNRAKNWQDLFWIGFTASAVCRTYLTARQQDQAALSLLDGIDWHLAIGQTWQTLGAMWGAIVDFPQLFEDSLGILILSMVYHHPEALPYYRARIEEARPRFEKNIGADVFASAWEEGQALDFDTVVAQMRAALAGDTAQ